MTKRLGALLAVVLLSAPLSADVIEQVLVRVNGDILTKSDFEQRQINALRTRPDAANLSADNAEFRRLITQITPGLVLDAVDELLLVQRGRELGYSMSDEQFNSIVANIKKQNNLEDEAKFQAALKQEGMTLPDLRRSLERQMLVSRVVQTDISTKVTVSEEDARAYYQAHKQEFTAPTSLTLREILIAVPPSERGVNVAQDEATREKALSIRNRLLGGESFAKVAGEASDSGSKANGGLVGPSSRDELDPSIQQILDRMKPGDVSEPIRTTRGYQLLQLEARTETSVKSFEEARNEIGDKVGEQKMQIERERYVEKLRSEATIVWHNDELKRAYEQALTQRRAITPGAQQTAQR